MPSQQEASAAAPDPRQATVLYKILLPSEAEQLPSIKWSGTQLDQKDGFLHFSSKHQLPGTLSRFFAHVEEVVICALPLSTLALGEAAAEDRPRRTLQYDQSHGQFFGHIYGMIDPETHLVWRRTYRSAAGGWDSVDVSDLTF
ncbi:hypothetical protein IE81DRAFT_325743 [Ceraceosorus guamensis]|uniref:DUF952-domain-containing protein n=1 Tax=Ceraceosorus guamensis TaxID=1522189 RepID=A0A316VRI7_9BASI|nr:hypothetical protein IE81DRAFT_325743 [Ceraceosorus guamensis]PWN40269.1 hypothetical protein IE81DRAFT_325743 [Ceraceosorus guamensis]